MNRKMVSHFLSRIHTFPDQEFCCLAEYLPSSKRYVRTRYVCTENNKQILVSEKLSLNGSIKYYCFQYYYY